MAKAPEVASGASEKLVEVKLLRNYVPANPDLEEGPDGKMVFKKRWAGEAITLPRDEAKRALDLGIAAITADLI